jgi:hypothetical protein
MHHSSTLIHVVTGGPDLGTTGITGDGRQARVSIGGW